MSATLIISDTDDCHIPFVSRHLKQKPTIIGSLGVINNENLSIFADRKKTRLHYNGTIIPPPDSVWYRKPMFTLLKGLPVDKLYEPYAKSAVKGHIEGIYPLLESAFWISDYFAIQRASSKPLQAIRARKIGFNIPDTLFTSSEASARQFIKSHTTSVVKSLASIFPVSEQEDRACFFFTRKVHKNEEIDLSGLHLAPAIFQEAIDTDFDIRVTVVGKKVFATAIRASHNDKNYKKILDWRIGDHTRTNHFEAFQLPQKIAHMCVQHVNDLGLQYGAIDLVQDKKGVIWYLENNPNGQWAFVEEETGQAIGKAMAELLETKHS